jgi:hypothetical protein
MDASIGRHARAKFSYKALYEADLAVRKGDVVEIVEVVVAGCEELSSCVVARPTDVRALTSC